MRYLLRLAPILICISATACFAEPNDFEKYPPYKLTLAGKAHLGASWSVNVFDKQQVYDVCEIYRSLLTRAAASVHADLHRAGTTHQLWSDYKSGKYETNSLLCESMKQAIPRRVMLVDLVGEDAVEKFDDSLADQGWKFKPSRPKGHHLPEYGQYEPGAFIPPTKKTHLGDFNATLKKKVFEPHTDGARKGN